MRRFPFRMSVRALMAAVAIISLLLWAEATRRRWARFEERASFHARKERLHRVREDTYLKSIEFQINDMKQAGEEPNWEVGSLAVFRKHANREAEEAENHSRLKRYFESKW